MGCGASTAEEKEAKARALFGQLDLDNTGTLSAKELYNSFENSDLLNKGKEELYEELYQKGAPRRCSSTRVEAAPR